MNLSIDTSLVTMVKTNSLRRMKLPIVLHSAIMTNVNIVIGKVVRAYATRRKQNELQ